jgi:hypothetical protein
VTEERQNDERFVTDTHDWLIDPDADDVGSPARISSV